MNFDVAKQNICGLTDATDALFGEKKKFKLYICLFARMNSLVSLSLSLSHEPKK